MPDPFAPQERSRIMARVRSQGTKPESRLEMLVRELLEPPHQIDTHRDDLPGTPDLVIPALRVCIFVDGCFWHRCPRHGSVPESNRDYWESKLKRNVARDSRVRRQLNRAGWSVWRVWEHDLSPTRLEATAARLSRRFTARGLEMAP
jgi:DNA mismatch endonuclease, patch repair protein